MARPPKERANELLSKAVRRGSYFFLDLQPRGTGPVRLAFGGREQCGEDYLVQRSTYPFFTLEYVAEGEGQIGFLGAEPLPLRPGTLFAHGPGIALRMETLPGKTLVKYFVCFSGRGARAWIDRHAPVFGRTVAIVRHGHLREIFDLLVREGGEHTPFTHPICDRLGDVLLLKISEALRHRDGSRHETARDKFLRCKALIDEEGGRFATLEEIATELRADLSGLTRLFRRYQGISPYQYLLRRKMNLAAQDLLHSGGLVKEAAARAGYADPYHFSRVFKSVHGISPAHFAGRTSAPV
jgi:AraC-like DNA-binding protein